MVGLDMDMIRMWEIIECKSLVHSVQHTLRSRIQFFPFTLIFCFELYYKVQGVLNCAESSLAKWIGSRERTPSCIAR